MIFICELTNYLKSKTPAPRINPRTISKLIYLSVPGEPESANALLSIAEVRPRSFS